MFKDFELPLLPTVVVGFMLLLYVAHAWNTPTHPSEAMRMLESQGAELIGNVVYVDHDLSSNAESSSVLSLAQQVWESRHEYDPSKSLEIRVKVPAE